MLIGRETETAGLGSFSTPLASAPVGRAGPARRGRHREDRAARRRRPPWPATSGCCGRPASSPRASSPYAALHQLLRPLEDRIDRLAEPQARALSGALGLAHEREADRFLIGVGVLTLLADAAEEQPLLALLDDAAWFDHESAHALGFTARRLQAEGVVLLFAVRDEPGQPFELPGVAELRVGASPTPRRGSSWATRVDARGATPSSHGARQPAGPAGARERADGRGAGRRRGGVARRAPRCPSARRSCC